LQKQKKKGKKVNKAVIEERDKQVRQLACSCSCTGSWSAAAAGLPATRRAMILVGLYCCCVFMCLLPTVTLTTYLYPDDI
jgi:hypothetical protein